MKPGLLALVVATSSLGYALARPFPFEWSTLLAITLGTALLGGGANALNQWMEIGPDSRMNRTKGRPLPTRKISAPAGFWFGTAISVAGLLLLAMRVNMLTAFLGAASWAIYIFAYTPMKRRTPLNTIVGAVSGAIPPVLGWTGASNHFEAGALVLFAILFLWQIPHFLSIAWIYREDYERGGFRMLPVLDPEGRTTFRIALTYTLGLIPATLSAAVLGMTGWIYAIGAIIGGLFLLVAAMRLEQRRTRDAARSLFFLTIGYLPALLALMVLDPTRLPFRLG